MFFCDFADFNFCVKYNHNSVTPFILVICWKLFVCIKQITPPSSGLKSSKLAVFFARLTFRPWRQRWHVPPKLWLTLEAQRLYLCTIKSVYCTVSKFHSPYFLHWFWYQKNRMFLSAFQNYSLLTHFPHHLSDVEWPESQWTKYSLILAEMFRFKPTSQSVQWYYSVVCCALEHSGSRFKLFMRIQ
jgi:hypothetical protein